MRSQVLAICKRFNFRGPVPSFLKKRIFLILLFTAILFIRNYTQLRYFTFKCGMNPFQTGQCFAANRTHNYKYIYNEPTLCSGDVYVLIVVESSPDEFTDRQTIRETWGSLATRKSKVRLAFMLGKAKIGQNNLLILKESETYHDIIQKDFIDSYRNLSLKSESILHYSNFYCRNAQFIFKTDSDMFINVPLLVESLERLKYTGAILGHTYTYKESNFYTSSKFTVKLLEYPLSHYPSWTAGAAYAIPGKFIKDMFEMSLKSKLFWIEDIYITGILRERLKIPLYDWQLTTFNVCSLKTCYVKDVISCHQKYTEEIRTLWYLLKNCSE